MRVVVIGVDSWDPGLVGTMLDAGRLPALATLRRRGTWIPLRSHGPEGRVWDSFLMGRAVPEDPHLLDPATYEPWWRGARPEATFFADVTPPIRTVAFDVPFFPLAHFGRGVAVTGWGSHNPGYPRAGSPDGLLEELEARFGAYPQRAVADPEWHDARSLRETADALTRGARKRADATSWLLEREPAWDLCLTVFGETHTAAEAMWHSVDAAHPVASAPTAGMARSCLEQVYEAVDGAVGAIGDGLPPDALLVVASLHGVRGENKDLAATVLLPELLHRMFHGRVLSDHPDPAQWASDGFPPIVLGAGRTWLDHMRARQRAAGAAERETRPTMRAALARRRRSLTRPSPRAARGTDEEWRDGWPVWDRRGTVTAWGARYWPSMPAFAVPTYYRGRVRVNLRGREASGVVDPGGYAETLDQVEAAIRACIDPRTGDPVVAAVRRPGAGDPFGLPDWEADLVVEWQGFPDAFEHPALGLIGPYPFRRVGGHAPHGFAVVVGPGVAAGERPCAGAEDLPPTILALLGRRADRPLEGDALPLRV